MNNASCPTDDMLIIACNGCGFGSIVWRSKYLFHAFGRNPMIGDSHAIPVYSQGRSLTNDIKCNANVTSKSAYSIVSSLTCRTYVRSWNILYSNNIQCWGYSQRAPNFWGYYYYYTPLLFLTQSTLLSANCLTGKW